MRAFELYDATTVEGAVELLRKNSDRAVKVVGGGSDLIGGMMKDWVHGKGLPFPDVLIDLTTIKDLTSISVGDTTSIGAAFQVRGVRDEARAASCCSLLMSKPVELARSAPNRSQASFAASLSMSSTFSQPA